MNQEWINQLLKISITMAKFKGPNAKQEAGRDKKAANAAVKQAASDKAREATEAQEWKKGSNVRGAVKSAAVGEWRTLQFKPFVRTRIWSQR